MRVWNIKALTDILGPQTSKHLLFLHAVLGCDTTSRLYGVGKSVSLRKFLKNDDFKKVAHDFTMKILHRKRSQRQENTHGLVFTTAAETKSWKICDIDAFVKKSPPAKTTSSLKLFHQHRWLQNTTVGEYSFKFNSGRVWRVMLFRNSGVGKLRMTFYFQSEQICLQHPKIPCVSSVVTVWQIAVQWNARVRKNSLDCSAAYGQCRGSGCANSVTQMSDDDDDDCPDTWVSLLMC